MSPQKQDLSCFILLVFKVVYVWESDYKNNRFAQRLYVPGKGISVMRLEQILNETLELLLANEQDPRFKNFGALQKSKFQHSKPEEDTFLRSDMYKRNKKEF